MLLTALDANNPLQSFPPASQALIDPNGLLAIGGCLSPQRLINAYQSGIFPWYNPGEPILWWSPDPRMVLFPQRLQISRSLHKQLRNHAYRIRFDSAFAEVMAACAAPRQQHAG